MKQVKIFTTHECPKCPAAKEMGVLLQKEGVPVSYFDLETPDGLAEAAFYSVLSTPTVIVEDAEESLLGDWRGSVPPLQEIRQVLTDVWN